MYKQLEPYGKLVDFLGEALGDNVEIALHDLTSQEQEIVAIANSHISGREVGAKLSNYQSIHLVNQTKYKDHDYVMNYKTTGQMGSYYVQQLILSKKMVENYQLECYVLMLIFLIMNI